MDNVGAQDENPEVGNFYLTQCIYWLVLESQRPHEMISHSEQQVEDVVGELNFQDQLINALCEITFAHKVAFS